jgi:hypothetical protein
MAQAGEGEGGLNCAAGTRLRARRWKLLRGTTEGIGGLLEVWWLW